MDNPMRDFETEAYTKPAFDSHIGQPIGGPTPARYDWVQNAEKSPRSPAGAKPRDVGIALRADEAIHRGVDLAIANAGETRVQAAAAKS